LLGWSFIFSIHSQILQQNIQGKRG
jgi:hypothetical protein